MKNLRKLNKFFIIFLLYSHFPESVLSNEPVDIWDIKKKEDTNKEIILENESNNSLEINQIIKIEKQDEEILVNNTFGEDKIKLAGLYDPA